MDCKVHCRFLRRLKALKWMKIRQELVCQHEEQIYWCTSELSGRWDWSVATKSEEQRARYAVRRRFFFSPRMHDAAYRCRRAAFRSRCRRTDNISSPSRPEREEGSRRRRRRTGRWSLGPPSCPGPVSLDPRRTRLERRRRKKECRTVTQTSSVCVTLRDDFPSE